MGGLYGGLFAKYFPELLKRQSKLTWSPIRQMFFAISIISFLNFMNGFLKIDSSQLLAKLFIECHENEPDFNGLCSSNQFFIVLSLLLAAAFKVAFTAISFTLFIPAGIFIPSMAIGALFGRALGITVSHIQQNFNLITCNETCITPGTYAMIGAASAFSGITRLTVTVVVVMFELTGAVSYIVPMMLAVMISKFVGDLVSRFSVVDVLIQWKEYVYLDPNVVVGEGGIPIEIVASGDFLPTLLVDMPVEELLRTAKADGYPIIDHSNIILGYITHSDLQTALSNLPQSPLPNNIPNTQSTLQDTQSNLPHKPFDLLRHAQHPVTVNMDCSLDHVAQLFKKMSVSFVLVESRGRLVGKISKHEFIKYLLKNK